MTARDDSQFLRYSRIGDAERELMQQSAFNFYTLTGRKMRIPPALHEHLRNSGVIMKHMVADANLTDSLMPTIDPVTGLPK